MKPAYNKHKNPARKTPLLSYLICSFMAVVLCGCFTGVENTKKITEKDVRRAIEQAEKSATRSSLVGYSDSLPSWQVGKQFRVTDNHIRLIFAPSPTYNTDTLHLAGHNLSYMGYDTGSILDNRATVNIKLTDGHNVYVFNTGKTAEEFSSSWSIPFMVNIDEVAHYAKQLNGRKAYIKTSIWYNPVTEEMTAGRKFISVKIDSVLPGNKVFPLKVLFTADDDHRQAMVWMAGNNSLMQGRDFDSLFSLSDIKNQYPTISGQTWQHIIRGTVVEGMTKEECRLALGNAKRTESRPTYDGLREYWYYDGGTYLIFIDGLLHTYRK